VNIASIKELFALHFNFANAASPSQFGHNFLLTAIFLLTNCFFIDRFFSKNASFSVNLWP
jgi:hypothetical protein